MGPRHDKGGTRLGRRKRVLGESPVRRDPPYLVRVEFREPQRAVRPHCDPERPRLRRREGILLDGAIRRDPTDLVAPMLREPERAVRPRGYAVRPRSLLGKRVFFDRGTSFGAFHSTPPQRTRCGDCITLRLPLEMIEAGINGYRRRCERDRALTSTIMYRRSL